MNKTGKSQRPTRRGAPQKVSPSAVTIDERLRRMISDADAIKERLLGAPLGLTGSKEPALWNAIGDINNRLIAAQIAWEE